jgi:protein phosphatase
MLQFRYDALSDTGRVRDNNEDSGFAGPYLLCVADGVGGAAAGEVASATTAYVVSARALAHPGHDPLQVLRRAISEAHDHITDGVVMSPHRQGMATTLTAVLTDGQRFGLAQVGDSRAYLIRDGAISQLSKDQTLVQEMVDAGRMTPEQAAASPYKHIVLRAVDATTTPEPDLVWLDLLPGDRLLLCTDGLTDVLPRSALAVLGTLPDRADAAWNLVEAALDGGSQDNVTVIVADVVDAAPVVGTGTVLGAALDLANVVDPAGIRPLRSA